MAKREVDQESHYKKIISKQKTIIQELKKKAGRGEKTQERFDELEQELIAQLEEEAATPYTKATEADRCPDCLKGTFELIDLKVRKMRVCNKCGFRKIGK